MTENYYKSMIGSYYKVWHEVIAKCDRKLLQSVTGSYCKVWQALQSAVSITNCDRKLLQKYDRKLLQSVTRSHCKVW